MSDHHRQAAFYNTCVTRANVQKQHHRRPTTCEVTESTRLPTDESGCPILQQDEIRCGESEASDAIDTEKCVFNMADFYESIPGNDFLKVLILFNCQSIYRKFVFRLQ